MFGRNKKKKEKTKMRGSSMGEQPVVSGTAEGSSPSSAEFNATKNWECLSCGYKRTRRVKIEHEKSQIQILDINEVCPECYHCLKVVGYDIDGGLSQ